MTAGIPRTSDRATNIGDFIPFVGRSRLGLDFATAAERLTWWTTGD
jgi:hypothetical protein